MRERVELVSGTAGGTAPVAPASDPGRAQAAIFHESQDFGTCERGLKTKKQKTEGAQGPTASPLVPVERKSQQ